MLGQVMDIQMISIYPRSAWHVLSWEHIYRIYTEYIYRIYTEYIYRIVLFSIFEHATHAANDIIWFAASLMVCIVVYCIVDIYIILMSNCGKISVLRHHYQWILGNSTSIVNITHDGHVRKTWRWTVKEHQKLGQFTQKKRNCLRRTRWKFFRGLDRKISNFPTLQIFACNWCLKMRVV